MCNYLDMGMSIAADRYHYGINKLRILSFNGSDQEKY